ncbi:hypothetical protein HKCCSP123_17680, partial [Rhodobacterales bacterium HKCCSP123]|nr:hypothetical protein [Rhodobacterales bacterium HKCCSP123]
MLPYWIMFLFPAIAAMGSGPTSAFNEDGTRRIRWTLAWFGVVALIAAAIGFRYDVGGDWNEYFRYIFIAPYVRFQDLRYFDDPGFMAVTLLSV